MGALIFEYAGVKKRRKPRDTEHQHQVALMRRVALAKKGYPELEMLYAIPNGGARNVVVAKKLKAEGVMAGVPDLHIPVARQGFHSLYIELKAPKGRVSDTQVAFGEKLATCGNLVVVAWGWEAAFGVILWYLTGKQKHWPEGEAKRL